MSLANIEGKLSVAEMEQIMAGSGEEFWGWGSIYDLGCINGRRDFFQDYYVFWLGWSTRSVGNESC